MHGDIMKRLASGPSRMLGTATDGFLASTFGRSLRDVRLYTGSDRDALLDAQGAEALSFGETVVLPSDVAPSSQTGRALLAHELTHVQQFRAGRLQGPRAKGLGDNDPLEAEAEEAERAALRGQQTPRLQVERLRVQTAGRPLRTPQLDALCRRAIAAAEADELPAGLHLETLRIRIDLRGLSDAEAVRLLARELRAALHRAAPRPRRGRPRLARAGKALEARGRYWYAPEAGLDAGRYPVIVRAEADARLRIQQADGRVHEVPAAHVYEKGGQQGWEDAWASASAPSPWTPDSKEDRERAARRELGAALRKLNNAGDPETWPERAALAEALAERCRADAEHIYAAACLHYARSCLQAHLDAFDSHERGAVERRIAGLDRRAAALENAALDTTLTDLVPIFDDRERALAVAARREALAGIRTRFGEAYDAFDRGLGAKAPERASGQEYVAAVVELGATLSEDFRGFLTRLVVECEAELGGPPRKYAVLAMGSMARRDFTPRSDFEWAILVDDAAGPPSELELAWFHNLARLLHLKVVNLGETILPAVNLPELGPFWDRTIQAGLQADGMIDRASKLPVQPLHHQHLVGEPPELLNPSLTDTATGLARTSLDERYLGQPNTKNLWSTLGNFDTIYGDASLTARYGKARDELLGVGSKEPEARHRSLGCVLIRDALSWPLESLETLKSRADGVLVKKDLYRQVNLLVEGLRTFYGLGMSTPFVAIESLSAFEDDGWNAAKRADLALCLAIAIDLRYKSTHVAARPSMYSRLTPSASDEQKIERFLALLPGLRKLAQQVVDAHDPR